MLYSKLCFIGDGLIHVSSGVNICFSWEKAVSRRGANCYQWQLALNIHSHSMTVTLMAKVTPCYWTELCPVFLSMAPLFICKLCESTLLCVRQEGHHLGAKVLWFWCLFFIYYKTNIMLKLKKKFQMTFFVVFFNRLFHSLSLILLLIFLSQLIIIISLNVWIFWCFVLLHLSFTVWSGYGHFTSLWCLTLVA